MTALGNTPAGEQSDHICLLNSILWLCCMLSPVQMMLSFQQHPALSLFTSFTNDGELKSALSGVACAQPFFAVRKTEAQNALLLPATLECRAHSCIEIHPKPLSPWYSRRRATALSSPAIGTFTWEFLSLGPCQVICSLSISDQPGPW